MVWTMKEEFARYVGKFLSAISITRQKRVQGSAEVYYVPIVSIHKAGTEPVYNMEVEKVHNFSANGGIVVHNCADAIRYRINALPKWRIGV